MTNNLDKAKLYEFLGIDPTNPFANYDAIEDIHNYTTFLMSFPPPADILQKDEFEPSWKEDENRWEDYEDNYDDTINLNAEIDDDDFQLRLEDETACNIDNESESDSDVEWNSYY